MMDTSVNENTKLTKTRGFIIELKLVKNRKSNLFDFALHNTGNKRLLVSHRSRSPVLSPVITPSTWQVRCVPDSSFREQHRGFSSPPGQHPLSQGMLG